VSVLRGDGDQEGVPFIDDYICTTEPVLDYLTEYSGIEGDYNVDKRW
jgi:PAB-dependent poly(A)-specific ribonuclease subunit 2